jgi:hypothetical protein
LRLRLLSAQLSLRLVAEEFERQSLGVERRRD